MTNHSHQIVQKLWKYCNVIWSEEKTRELVQAISLVATVVRTIPRLGVIEDEPDNRILKCAIHAHGDVIVTGDRHLLTLKHYESVKMIRLADFLELLAGSERT